MPVVTVLAPAHDAVPALLGDVADAVVAALGLAPTDVIAVHAHAGATATGGGGRTDPWIVATICGSDRGREKMDAARAAAESAVAAWATRSDIELGGVWTQWQTPHATNP